jgi:metal-responsive CopG/Arc/MetJ family transcriptional regulator
MAKVIISLPDELLEKVDRYCDDFEYNRSEFVRFALRAIVDNKTNKKTDEDTN